MKTLVYFILILVLSSCCKPKLIDTIRFTEDELSVNPYNGSEKLVFVDNNGITITYDNGWRRINTMEIDECDGGCCDYYLVECYDNTLFESTYMKSNLHVIISNSFDKYLGIKGTPFIHFAWDYYEILPYVTVTSFGSLPVDSMKEKGIEYGIFKDSLILRQKMFYEVFTFPGNCPYSDRLHGDTLYFTKTQGIIGLKFSDGNLWVIE